ncbi:MAG: hypothetical protein JNJ77_07410 [Planctomycetia bacterium]|nr:hypothetical protein [Planctomycetia bacterium]
MAIKRADVESTVDQSHVHGTNCGHTGIMHDGHVDYLQNGQLQHTAGGQVVQHSLSVSATNPADCTPSHQCGGHDQGHVHSASCGHPAVPHGDHVDYLVNGHLHHPHGDHCDDHGKVQTV